MLFKTPKVLKGLPYTVFFGKFTSVFKIKEFFPLNYRWTFRELPDESTIHRLAGKLQIPKSLARVLTARGVSSDEEAGNFFSPSLEHLPSPFLMEDMQKAVERIEYAIRHKELIWIHGDYDVDGTTSTAMTLQFLRELGAQVQYYIPDRMTEGYGLSIASITAAKTAGASLVVTVDCGITSVDAVDAARHMGMDCIIVDHHKPGEKLPEALAILDPIKPGCPYPFKALAACGVAFKLIHALAISRGEPERAFAYLDFVAIASAADIVPILGENRILMHYGLELLNTFPRAGFKGLLECAGIQIGTVTTASVVYGLAPRINAAGRVGDARRAVEMMIQIDELAAFRIAQELEQENRRRRALDESAFDDASRRADEFLKDANKRSLVLFSPDWHAGIIGIVASRLVERFNMPSVMLTKFDDYAKGSARSVRSFDIFSALKSCEHHLQEFGGHKHAAGVSLPIANIDAFREAFDEQARVGISKEMLLPEIVIDTELHFNELSPDFISIIKRFAPFGHQNFRPVFHSNHVTSANGARIVGNNHLKFRAFQSNFVIDAIGFNLGDKIKHCADGKSFSIAYTIEENSFNGQTTPQLRLRDIRPGDSL